ncbi:MAG: N-acetylmuramoyl-L-alanine amidase [Hyphomicrobiales bacterium]|nr:N-acetylmuramoyl-L-alanine amidase [Hyphomicrobiales bacterium]
MIAFTPDSALVDLVTPSPNHGDRRGRRVDSLILHYTGMPTAEGALQRLCDAAAEVSSHYLVFEDGRIAQLVPEDRRAWHAGRSFWAGETDMNSASIGVEIVNPGHDAGAPPFPEAQIEAVIRLAADVMQRRGIAPERVLAHSDIAPGRKVDPGESFPWARLASCGVGLWREPAPLADGLVLARGATGDRVRALQDGLASLGYGIDATGEYDAATETVVGAFQRRWRPARIDGAADVSTARTLDALLKLRRA